MFHTECLLARPKRQRDSSQRERPVQTFWYYNGTVEFFSIGPHIHFDMALGMH